MNPVLSTVDYVIVAAYSIALFALGIYLQRRASKSVEDYLIGSRQLPWWALGFSGMAAFLDVAGTMLIVSFLFMLGPRGLFVEFRGGAVLVLIPMMLWTGKWHRRSGCLTGAEWMTFRFGDGWGGRLAQLTKAISGIVLTIGMLGYLIKGIGIFLSTFMPFSPFVCALGLVSIAAIYTMMSGFYGVVVTDLFQSLIIIVSITAVCVLAVAQIESSDELFETAQRATNNSEWMAATPQWKTAMPDGYKMFESLMMFTIIYTLRNLFFGLGAGDDPKYFGAKSDAECSKLSLLWVTLMGFRWPMMMGFAVLGIYLVSDIFQSGEVQQLVAETIKNSFETSKETWHTTIATISNSSAEQYLDLKESLQAQLGDGWREKIQLISFHGTTDPERVMPAVLTSRIPHGLRGLMLVALIAASMSTFDSEVNKTSGYFARDIYQKYVRPTASPGEVITCTWFFILFLVTTGFLFAFTLKNINDIWGWIIMGLGGGLMAPLILRMYWWRFNGAGFAMGTICGMVAAILQRIFFKDLGEHVALIVLAVIGFSGSIIGSYLAAPTDHHVLRKFYFATRPFGLWSKLAKEMPDDLRQAMHHEHLRDIAAIPFALMYQVCLFLFPMLLLIGSYQQGFICLALGIVGLLGLYFVWLRHSAEPDKLEQKVLTWLEEKG